MSDFIVVSHKKKKRKGKISNGAQYDEKSTTYFEKLKERVLQAQAVVSGSDVYLSIQSYIENSLNDLQQPGVPEIVCYGLGNVADDQNVRYQFGLVLELKKFFSSELFLYDPVFKKVEKDLMLNLKCSLIDKNEHGKRKTSRVTLFFLPHCPHELLNNVIAANWGEDLCNCIILSNSVNEVCSTLPDQKLQDDLPFVLKIHSFVSEREVHNSFKPVGAFNDLSVHFFMKNNYKDALIKELDPVEEIIKSIKDVQV